jgi:hypothetical protein
MTLGIAVLLIAQTAVGMAVNLYVMVPVHHPGAQPANYFTGSLRSIAWATGHGTLALAIHASLGLAIVAIAIWVAMVWSSGPASTERASSTSTTTSALSSWPYWP